MPELPRPLPPPSLAERAQALVRGGAVPVGPLLIAVVLAVGLVAGAFILRGGVAGSGGPDVALSLPRADTGAAGSSDASARTTVAKELRVHAAGAVVHPGVVVVPAGARVADVVAAAGGPAVDADLDQVNLAAPVADGERIYVPRQGEAAPPPIAGGATASGPASDGIVNINTADLAALETLPGVGPSTAQAIIDYRREHGRFRSLDDLLNVRGIGPAKLSQIKPRARV